MPQNSKSTANAGNISKFKISANLSDRAREMTNAVAEFRYYESVLSNNITATAALVETGYAEEGGQDSFAQGTLDWLPIRGGERTDVIIEDAQEEPNEINFNTDGIYVNRVRDVDPGTQKDVYFVDLASKEYFSNDMTRVSKKYEGKISDNVEEILEEIVLGTWAEKEGGGKDIDETAVPYNFVGCDKKPFYICTWLAAKSIPTGSGDIGIGGAAGYFFWQTRDGFHFRSIDKMFDEGKQNRDSLKKFIYNNTGELVEGYDANIVSYNIDSDIDLNEKLMMGSYNNRSLYFDYYAFNYKVVDFNITKQQGKGVSTAGGEYINIAEEFTRSPSRLMAHIMDYGVLPRGVDSDAQLEEWKDAPEQPNYDAEQTMVQSIMRYNQLFTVKTSIIIPGDFSIQAGDLIVVDFPELDGDSNKEVNPQSGGIYMVAEVCHKITPRECFTSMTLIRDSFGTST